MNKFNGFLFAVLLGLPAVVKAYEEDHGSFGDRSWSGGRRAAQYHLGSDTTKPIYYRPTQRYYGSGYTISYRYVPVYQHESAATSANNFRAEAFLIPTDQIPAWGINPPRLTVKDPKSGMPRTAVTSIVRKKTTSKTSTKSSNEAAPVETPAAAVSEAAAPAPIPAPTETPAKP